MQENYTAPPTCRKIIRHAEKIIMKFSACTIAATANEVVAIELKDGRVDSRSIFDALSIGEGFVAAVLLWAAQYYHKVRGCLIDVFRGSTDI